MTMFHFVQMIMLINIGLIIVLLIILFCKNGRKRAVITLLLPFFNYSQKASLTNSCAHSRPTDSLKMRLYIDASISSVLFHIRCQGLL